MHAVGIWDFDVYSATKVFAVIIFVIVFFDPPEDLQWERHAEVPDVVGEVRRNIAEVVAVRVIYGNRVRVILIGGFGLDIAEELTNVLLYAFAEDDACNGKVQ